MAEPCRSWWRNCALEADAEILAIDRMEDTIAPLASTVTKIRELISTLELCHHKAENWVFNIIEAIGVGATTKGLGSRSAGQYHAIEQVWQNAGAALSAWCAGSPAQSLDLAIDTIPARQMLAGVGERSPLKEWQVLRVIEKIHSLIHWPQSCNDPMAQYPWILFSGGDYESIYHNQCPEHYLEHKDFWLATVRSLIHDTVDGQPSELSLALAIDMLWPCHWNFVENLRIVLAAIGGNLYPAHPFAACGRNIILLPNRDRMEIIANTLNVFCGDLAATTEVDSRLLTLAGQPTAVKRWLAASLAKTIRLQLKPPAELRVLSDLTGPAWIKQ